MVINWLYYLATLRSWLAYVCIIYTYDSTNEHTSKLHAHVHVYTVSFRGKGILNLTSFLVCVHAHVHVHTYQAHEVRTQCICLHMYIYSCGISPAPSMQAVDFHSPQWCRPILKREPFSLFHVLCHHDLQIGHMPETTITNLKVQGTLWAQLRWALKYSDTISTSWRAISRGWSYGWDNEPFSFSLVKQHGLAVLKHSIQYEVLGASRV